jgi:hypothetical protein
MWQSLTELTLEAVPSSGVPEFLDALPSDFSGHGGSCKAQSNSPTDSKQVQVSNFNDDDGMQT